MNDQVMKRPYRVVQWATGNIGSRALQAVIGHPNMALAGLYVHSENLPQVIADLSER
jgi:hypothetical protein